MPDKIGILSSQRGYHVQELEKAILRRDCEPVYFRYRWRRLDQQAAGHSIRLE
jgi:hypothetical protein